MHRKTADKLCVAQNHLLFDAFLTVIFVIERYCFIINSPNSTIADGNFMRVSAQNVREKTEKNGLRIGKPNCFLCLISMWFLRFRIA